MMIQSSTPISFVSSGSPLFWTKGLTVYGTHFTMRYFTHERIQKAVFLRLSLSKVKEQAS
jgi:hypothetical protein